MNIPKFKRVEGLRTFSRTKSCDYVFFLWLCFNWKCLKM